MRSKPQSPLPQDLKASPKGRKPYNTQLLPHLRLSEVYCVYLNFLPVERKNFLASVPEAGEYEEVFNSDATEFGGAGNINAGVLSSKPCDLPRDYRHALTITLPAMSAVVLKKVQSAECRMQSAEL